MTNEEIQEHIKKNCRNTEGKPMMDEQAFYEGAKWMRDKLLPKGGETWCQCNMPSPGMNEKCQRCKRVIIF